MRRAGAALAVVFSLMWAGWLAAAEITVLSGGAIEPGLKAAVAAFQRETGHAVRITFNTAPQMAKRIGAGEVFDLVIAPPAGIEGFTKQGRLAGEPVNVGRVGVGVAVRPGAPKPDLSNADALRRAILEADSLVFNRASTGLYFEKLMQRVGLHEQVEKKSTRYPDGASVMEHLLKGKGREIGFGAATEILLYREKGLVFVGPLPAEWQNYTSYLAVPMKAGTQQELAQSLARFLGGPSGKPLFVAAGIE